jgi:hypothetical protein
MKISIAKKAEMTTAQIVEVTFAILSFGVIMIVLFFLNPAEVEAKELCHHSVLSNSRSIGLAGPLDCKTSYVCISAGENCEGFNSETSRQINLKGSEKEKKDAVMEAIAEEMGDCWWMFGEGKVDYGKNFGTSLKCSICSIIKFDSSITSEFSKISYMDLYAYLEEAQKDKEQTYLEYLYGVKILRSLKIPSEFSININKDEINTSERYSIITGIDDNFFLSDELMEVVIVPTKKTSSLVKCGEFLTRA